MYSNFAARESEVGKDSEGGSLWLVQSKTFEQQQNGGGWANQIADFLLVVRDWREEAGHWRGV